VRSSVGAVMTGCARHVPVHATPPVTIIHWPASRRQPFASARVGTNRARRVGRNGTGGHDGWRSQWCVRRQGRQWHDKGAQMRRSSRARLVVAATTALLALIVLSLPASAGPPTTRWVDDDGHAGPSGCSGTSVAYTKIQPAINASAEGDTINVCPGTYRQFLHVWSDKPSLTIRAVSPGTAIVKPPNAPDGPVQTHSSLLELFEAHNVLVTGLTFRIPTAGACWHLLNAVDASSLDGGSLRGNVIEATGPNTLGACRYDTGIAIGFSPTFTVVNNTIRDVAETGISISEAAGLIRHNTLDFWHLSRPAVTTGTGIVAGALSAADLRENIINGVASAGLTTPRLGEAILLSAPLPGSVVSHNAISRVGAGIVVDTGYGYAVDIHGNLVENGTRQGLRIAGGGITVTENDVQGFRVGIDIISNTTGVPDLIQDNDFRGNATIDCRDRTGATIGSLADTWIANRGAKARSVPWGLCQP
jgi:hypothetical protein